MKIEGLRFGYEDLKNCKIFFEVLLILFKVLEGKGYIYMKKYVLCEIKKKY